MDISSIDSCMDRMDGCMHALVYGLLFLSGCARTHASTVPRECAMRVCVCAMRVCVSQCRRRGMCVIRVIRRVIRV